MDYGSVDKKASLVAQWSRICLPMQKRQEMRVHSLDQKDPLEEGMAAYSSILAWRVPWTKQPGRLQSIGSQRVRLSLVTDHACTQTRRISYPTFSGYIWIQKFLSNGTSCEVNVLYGCRFTHTQLASLVSVISLIIFLNSYTAERML